MSSGPRIAVAATHRTPRKKSEVHAPLYRAEDSLNARFGNILVAPIEVGETQVSAVVGDATRAFDFAIALQESAWPIPLRVAMVSVGHREGPAADRTGRARVLEALTEAEKTRTPFFFQFPGRSDSETALAQAAAFLHATLMAEWTTTRAKAVRTYRELGRQREVAKKLHVSQQAVSQMLRGARLLEMAELESAMREWLQTEKRPGLWPLKRFEKNPVD